MLSVLIVSGIMVVTGIFAFGAQNAIPGTNNQYVSVVKAPTAGQSPEQRSERHGHYEARVKNLSDIANHDERVQALVAGKQVKVVGVRVPRGSSADERDTLLLKVNGTFYRITINPADQKVVSIEQRTCYGPDCNK